MRGVGTIKRGEETFKAGWCHQTSGQPIDGLGRQLMMQQTATTKCSRSGDMRRPIRLTLPPFRPGGLQTLSPAYHFALEQSLMLLASGGGHCHCQSSCRWSKWADGEAQRSGLSQLIIAGIHGFKSAAQYQAPYVHVGSSMGPLLLIPR